MSLKVTTQSLFWPPVTEVENGEETRKPQSSFVRLNHVREGVAQRRNIRSIVSFSFHLTVSVSLSCKQAIVNRRPTDSVRSCTTNWQLRHDQQRNQRADEQRKLASWKQRKEGRGDIRTPYAHLSLRLRENPARNYWACLLGGLIWTYLISNMKKYIIKLHQIPAGCAKTYAARDSETR